jgi:hypothetical protein
VRMGSVRETRNENEHLAVARMEEVIKTRKDELYV